MADESSIEINHRGHLSKRMSQDLPSRGSYHLFLRQKIYRNALEREARYFDCVAGV